MVALLSGTSAAQGEDRFSSDESEREGMTQQVKREKKELEKRMVRAEAGLRKERG